MKRLRIKKRSLLFLSVTDASKGRHCCPPEHARPSLRCCARIFSYQWTADYWNHSAVLLDTLQNLQQWTSGHNLTQLGSFSDKCCLLTSAVKMAFAQNSLVHRYEYSSCLLIGMLNKSIIRNSFGLTDGGNAIEEDKVSAVSSTLLLPGAEKGSVRALGWRWYFHPSSACSDLDSIRSSRTGGQQERREDRPDADSCLYIYYVHLLL